MVLTIAIPTYNRPEKLKGTLINLIPQLNAGVKIIVLDNSSDVDIANCVNELICTHKSAISVIRHRVNIGPDANFCRCFELCDTPYIWMLGDDDDVKPNAVQLILDEIEKFGADEPLGFNFYSNCVQGERREPVFIRGTSELVNKLDSFGNWLFISTSVYNTSAYRKYLYQAAWGSYSMASQLIPAMVAISKGGLFILSEKHIVDNIKAEDPEHKWSDFQLGLSVINLLETPIGLKKDEYFILGKKLAFHFDYIWPLSCLYIILKSVNFNIDLIDRYHIYLYKQFFSKTFPFRTRRLAQYMQYLICLFFLKNKRMLKGILKLRPGIRERAGQTAAFKLFIR